MTQSFYDPDEGFMVIDNAPTHAVVAAMGGGRDWFCLTCEQRIMKDYRTGGWRHAKKSSDRG